MKWSTGNISKWKLWTCCNQYTLQLCFQILQIVMVIVRIANILPSPHPLKKQSEQLSGPGLLVRPRERERWHLYINSYSTAPHILSLIVTVTFYCWLEVKNWCVVLPSVSAHFWTVLFYHSGMHINSFFFFFTLMFKFHA